MRRADASDADGLILHNTATITSDTPDTKSSNNSSSTEQFHFHSEIDRNSGKFLNGRLALNLPFGETFGFLSGHRLEIGASYEWGSQDWATDNEGKMWFAGVDLQYLTANFGLKAQWMKGQSPGRPEDRMGRTGSGLEMASRWL